MNLKRYQPAFIITSLTLLLWLSDELLKMAAQSYWQKPFVLVPKLISLRYEQNTGIAWSIALPQPLPVVINIALLLVLPYFFLTNLKMDQKISWLATSFLLAGALGNLTDRLIRGYVIDYLAVGSFPVFNLADALITLSIFLLVVFCDTIMRISPQKIQKSPKISSGHKK